MEFYYNLFGNCYILWKVSESYILNNLLREIYEFYYSSNVVLLLILLVVLKFLKYWWILGGKLGKFNIVFLLVILV